MLSSDPSFFFVSHSLSTFATCGTTAAKGLYANLFFVLTHYAFGGVSAQCVLLALSTPLRLRGRIGVFRRREGSASLPFSWGSPSHSEGCRRRIWVGSVLPSSSSTFSSLSSPTRGKNVHLGVRMCFPGATAYIFDSVFL